MFFLSGTDPPVGTEYPNAVSVRSLIWNVRNHLDTDDGRYHQCSDYIYNLCIYDEENLTENVDN